MSFECRKMRNIDIVLNKDINYNDFRLAKNKIPEYIYINNAKIKNNNIIGFRIRDFF